MRAVHTHCALDLVLGLGHCFWFTVHGHCSLTLFMDIVHSKKKKKDPQVLGRHMFSLISPTYWLIRNNPRFGGSRSASVLRHW